MIHNEREYRITKNLLNKFETAQKSEGNPAIPDWVIAAQKNALLSQIEEMRAVIVEYEKIKSDEEFIWECPNLRDLPEYLIKARIASGLSQKDLADALKVKSQQIQRYESEYYKGANLNRLIDVASAVGVTVSGFIERVSKPGKESGSGLHKAILDINKFPIREMISRGWIAAQENTQSYITEYSGEHLTAALHRKKVYGKNKPDLYSLIAWQSRVLQKARAVIENKNIGEFHLDDSWVKDFVRLSIEDNSPALVRDYLANKGIILIIEKHLEKTYLDGAAIMTDTGNPVIALTLRHDRLDNFWFVLMHELGHIFKHIFHGFNMDFYDEENGNNGDAIEREADEFALDNMIPNELWDLCISKFTMTKEAVLADSKRLNINPAIIAGRIRKESGNYYVLTELVGSGIVRKLLKEDLE